MILSSLSASSSTSVPLPFRSFDASLSSCRLFIPLPDPPTFQRGPANLYVRFTIGVLRACHCFIAESSLYNEAPPLLFPPRPLRHPLNYDGFPSNLGVLRSDRPRKPIGSLVGLLSPLQGDLEAGGWKAARKTPPRQARRYFCLSAALFHTTHQSMNLYVGRNRKAATRVHGCTRTRMGEAGKRLLAEAQ